MNISISTLSSSMSNRIKAADFSSVEKAAQDAIDNFNAINKTVLGRTVGEIQGGIEALTQEVDDAIEQLEANFKPVISRVTEDVDNIGDKLIKNITGSVATDIQKITETAASAADGFLYEIIGGATPKAINESLQIVGATTAEITSTLQSLIDQSLGNIVAGVVDKLPWSDFMTANRIFVDRLNSLIGANSQIFIVDFVEKLGKNFETSLNSILDKSIPVDDVKDAFKFVAFGQYDQGFGIIKKHIEFPDEYDHYLNNVPKLQWPTNIKTAYDKFNTIKGDFYKLDVSVGSNVEQKSAINIGSNTVHVTNIGEAPSRTANEKSSTYKGITSSKDAWSFAYVKSIDELEALFRNANRTDGKEITGLTVHWSGTFLDQDIDSYWIHEKHKEMGLDGIGYHLIIKRDGTIQRARPLNLPGNHDEVQDQNFLGVCLIGGMNVHSASAVKPYIKYASAASFNMNQYNAYNKLLKSFHKVYPYAQVAGHYMTTKYEDIDPGFDVVGYSKSQFNHDNVIPENDQIWKTSPITLTTIKTYTESKLA